MMTITMNKEKTKRVFTPGVVPGFLCGLALGFFGLWLLVVVVVLVIAAVLICTIRRSLPGRAFLLSAVVGAIIGFAAAVLTFYMMWGGHD